MIVNYDELRRWSSARKGLITITPQACYENLNVQKYSGTAEINLPLFLLLWASLRKECLPATAWSIVLDKRQGSMITCPPDRERKRCHMCVVSTWWKPTCAESAECPGLKLIYFKIACKALTGSRFGWRNSTSWCRVLSISLITVLNEPWPLRK